MSTYTSISNKLLFSNLDQITFKINPVKHGSFLRMQDGSLAFTGDPAASYTLETNEHSLHKEVISLLQQHNISKTAITISGQGRFPPLVLVNRGDQLNIHSPLSYCCLSGPINVSGKLIALQAYNPEGKEVIIEQQRDRNIMTGTTTLSIQRDQTLSLQADQGVQSDPDGRGGSVRMGHWVEHSYDPVKNLTTLTPKHSAIHLYYKHYWQVLLLDYNIEIGDLGCKYSFFLEET